MAEIDHQGDSGREQYVVRRVSDGHVLPEAFEPEALRREGS